ncbi:MAG TPA: hypothetical protein VNN08_16250 [Thermoanaerobaculia bacterium]|nr:hypothetical protein [Thermoanaerobaculia bacterium]
MAFNPLVNAKIWLDKFDLTGDMNAIAIDQSVEQQDNTAFGIGTKITRPGLLALKASLAGFVNLGTGNSEEFLSSKLGVADVPLTIGPTTGAEGEPAYSFNADLATFSPIQGKVGDILKFTAEAQATSSKLVRGTILHNAARTGSGTGTIFNLGAVGATQALYAALHVPAISGGPTVTIKVQSAALVGFGSPTDRITFTAVTTTASQWAVPIPGAITDAFWRISWTFAGGASPSCTFIVNVGIL